MKRLEEGHKYLLDNNKDDGFVELTFYRDGNINDEGFLAGTTSQEVLRALIDRQKFLESQLPHTANQNIIYHLRKAIALFESRHLDRLVEKGIPIELIPACVDGHIVKNPSKQ